MYFLKQCNYSQNGAVDVQISNFCYPVLCSMRHIVVWCSLYISICETRVVNFISCLTIVLCFGAFSLPVLVLAPHIDTFALGIPLGDISAFIFDMNSLSMSSCMNFPFKSPVISHKSIFRHCLIVFL